MITTHITKFTTADIDQFIFERIEISCKSMYYLKELYNIVSTQILYIFMPYITDYRIINFKNLRVIYFSRANLHINLSKLTKLEDCWIILPSDLAIQITNKSCLSAAKQLEIFIKKYI